MFKLTLIGCCCNFNKTEIDKRSVKSANNYISKVGFLEFNDCLYGCLWSFYLFFSTQESKHLSGYILNPNSGLIKSDESPFETF